MELQTLRQYADSGLLYHQKHPVYPLEIWNYTEKVQYESLWDEVTLSCRGLVTWTDTGEIVARPFRKFFNLEEGKHNPTPDFEVFEKIDGSLIIAFFVWDRWFVSSRGSFTSDQAVAGQKLLDALDTSTLDDEYTYLFELTAPWNRIVVDYGNEDKLTLLGAFRTHDGLEMSYEILNLTSKYIVCDITPRYDGVLDYSTLKGKISDKAEGFVIRFSNGDRMKIKGDEYLRLHKIMTNLSTTAIWEVLASGGDFTNLLVDVPDEFYRKVQEVAGDLTLRFDNLRKDYVSYHQEILEKIHPFDRKSYAQQAIRFAHSNLLFGILDGKDITPAIWKILKPEFKKL